MEERLLAYFSKFRPLTIEEKAAITENLTSRRYDRGSFILMPGREPTYNYFVVGGCVRKYYVRDGQETSTNFYIEDDWILPTVGASVNFVADYYLECIEDSALIVAGEDDGNDLLERFPSFEALARQMLEQEVLRQQVHIANYQNATPEERYLRLQDERPELIKRVPQFQLSSYIGVRPESLSRIRKRLANQATED